MELCKPSPSIFTCLFPWFPYGHMLSVIQLFTHGTLEAYEVSDKRLNRFRIILNMEWIGTFGQQHSQYQIITNMDDLDVEGQRDRVRSIRSDINWRIMRNSGVSKITPKIVHHPEGHNIKRQIKNAKQKHWTRTKNNVEVKLNDIEIQDTEMNS